MAKGKSKKKAVHRFLETAIDERVLQLLQETPGVKTSDLAERLGVSQLHIRNELMSLEQKGAVSRSGQTRGTRWYLGKTAPEVTSEASRTAAPDTIHTPIAVATPSTPAEAAADVRRGPKEKVLDENRSLLGTLPDAEVAARTGVSVRTIAGYRKKYGIAGYTGPRRRGQRMSDELTGLPDETAQPTPPKGAWRIEIRSRQQVQVRYALAQDLVEAARAASRDATARGGQVLSIAFAGELL